MKGRLKVPKKEVIDSEINKKIKYLGLNNISKNVLQVHDLSFKVLKGFDDKQYIQYRYINIKDIDILLTPTNRLDELQIRYDKAKPLYFYLNKESEKNNQRYATFLNMLKKVEIGDIEKVEKEQKMLQQNIPFRVKFNGNYLWQIYYSDSDNKYFMLVPTKDSDYSTFFYLLKRKIENLKDDKIFVPVSYVDYTGQILKKIEIKDLENYLWVFTKDYPSIYEVFDKNNKVSLQIIGETYIYGKIKTWYKMAFSDKREATRFYKLLKALFILQTELPRYFTFSTNIDENDEIQIYFGKTKILYEDLPKFVQKQYLNSLELKEITKNDIEELSYKLKSLKEEEKNLEEEYLIREKQISTYLECKKTFFGKVKYYFKFGKKFKIDDIDVEQDVKEVKINKEKVEKKEKNVTNKKYTLDALVVSCKELEILENRQRDIVMDINAKKLKNKNLKKKIENATSYINEINKHKKSIFEFWKYTNKDQVAQLEEGEEEVDTTKIEKAFNYDEDFEKFGEDVDKNQRKKFTDPELEAAFIASTNLLELVNKTYKKQAELKEFTENVKIIRESDEFESEEEFDVLGSLDSEKKERNLGSKVHRESPRKIINILNITKNTKGIDLKKQFVDIVKNIKKALKKNSLHEDMYVYKVLSDEIDFEDFQTFSLNEEDEMNRFLKQNPKCKKIYLYKIKLLKNMNFLAFTNIVYFDNKSMTLPVGMQLSNQILIDMKNLKFERADSKKFKKADFKNIKNDFSELQIREISVYELKAVKK